MAVEIQPRLIENGDNEKYCWICHNSQDDLSQWVKPCKCRGTAKWVHQNCLQIWVFEQQEGRIYIRNGNCSQCKTEYVISYPSPPLCITLLAKLERILIRNSSIFSFLCVNGAIMQYVAVGRLSTLCSVLLPVGLFQLETKVAHKLADWCAKDFGNNEIQLSQKIAVPCDFSEAVRLFISFSFPILSKSIAMLLKGYIVSSFRSKLFVIGLLFIGNTSAGVYLKYQYLLWNRQSQVILDYK